MLPKDLSSGESPGIVAAVAVRQSLSHRTPQASSRTLQALQQESIVESRSTVRIEVQGG